MINTDSNLETSLRAFASLEFRELVDNTRLDQLLNSNKRFEGDYSAATAPQPNVLGAIFANASRSAMALVGGVGIVSIAALVFGVLYISDPQPGTGLAAARNWMLTVLGQEKSGSMLRVQRAIPIINLSPEECRGLNINPYPDSLVYRFDTPLISEKTMHPAVEEIIHRVRRQVSALGYDTISQSTRVHQELTISAVEKSARESKLDSPRLGQTKRVGFNFHVLSPSAANAPSVTRDILFADVYENDEGQRPIRRTATSFDDDKHDWRAVASLRQERMLNDINLEKDSFDLGSSLSMPIRLDKEVYLHKALMLRLKVHSKGQEIVVLYTALPSSALLEKLTPEHRAYVEQSLKQLDRLSYDQESLHPLPGEYGSKVMNDIATKDVLPSMLELERADLKNLSMTASDSTLEFDMLCLHLPQKEVSPSDHASKQLAEHGFNVQHKFVYKRHFKVFSASMRDVEYSLVPARSFVKEYADDEQINLDELPQNLPLCFISKAYFVTRSVAGLIQDTALMLNIHDNIESPFFQRDNISTPWNAQYDRSLQQLVPFRYTMHTKYATDKHVVVLWFRASPALAKALPQRYGTILSQDLAAESAMQSNESNAAEICTERAEMPTILNPCMRTSELIKQLQIRPNPVRRELWVSFDLVQASDIQYQLFSLSGTEVKLNPAQTNYPAGHVEQHFDLPQCSEGIYELTIRNSAGVALHWMLMIQR